MDFAIRCLLALALLACGCGGCGADTEAPGDAASVAKSADDRYRPAFEFVEVLPWCDLSHRGLLLDMGSGALGGRFRRTLEEPKGLVTSHHDGATWARIYDRRVRLSFYLPQTERVFVAIRAIGKDAKSAVVYLNDLALGTLRFGRGEIRIKSTPTTKLPLDAGLHELMLHFRGREGSGAEPFAEVDWIRVGVPDDIERTYGAPTVQNVLTPAAELGGVPHRALAVRAPGSVRCTVQIPAGARLRTSIGVRGNGKATAALRVRSDDEEEEPAVLRWVEVQGGDSATWTDVDVSLDAFESQIVALELVAAKSSGTGRLLFGDPVVVVPTTKRATTPTAKAAVVVVLDGVEQQDLPPWRDGPTPHLPTLSALARSTTVFDGHRAPSSLVAGVVASLLAGTSPRSHSLADPRDRLPESVLTLGGIARDGSVRGAMFTAVPTTFEAFGFAHGWDHFVQYPPNGGRLADAPFADAVAWLADAKSAPTPDRRLLAVLHPRGGHPPWEITPKDVKKLPPAEYTGYLGPRRAAQLLAQIRGSRRLRLSEADLERMRAMYFASLSGQDAALGKLVEHLEQTGQWDSTLFIVTGDVSSARRTLFADGLELDEELLALPLYVHFPGGLHGGDRIARPTEMYDITRTTALALGLKPPAEMLGRDLAAVAAGPSYGPRQLRVAMTADRFSARWGDFVLLGKADKTAKLCRLSVDPTCAFDRRHMHPLVAEGIYRLLARFVEQQSKGAAEREPWFRDAETEATLKVWGSAE